jgi:NDP-sugar pyrophosphorylase family protein
VIQIVVPMTGDGRQFQERGYAQPKPLVAVAGQPLIEIVVRNLTPLSDHQFLFVCRQDHMAAGGLGDVLADIAPGCRVLPLRQPTASALCHVLLGVEQLQGEDELLIAHADQWIDESIDRFLASAREAGLDACLMTLDAGPPRWSGGQAAGESVATVTEPGALHHRDTAGLYYFRRSSDFLGAVERLLQQDASPVHEFYVAPVFSELLRSGSRVGAFDIHDSQMHALATPADVDRFQTRLFADVA